MIIMHLDVKESCTSYSLHMKWAMERKMACKQTNEATSTSAPQKKKNTEN